MSAEIMAYAWPSFMYADSGGQPRSVYLEMLFEDLYHGRKLDKRFRLNFIEYCETLFDIRDLTTRSKIFTDEKVALRFVSRFGMVSVSGIDPQWRSDSDFDHCHFQSCIDLKGKDIKPFKKELTCRQTVAPTKHYAILIALIEFMREITIAHIRRAEIDDNEENGPTLN